MGNDSSIEWTDATWNFVTGCTKVSSGCDHCYAERITERFHGKGAFAQVTLHPERLERPLRWRKPRRVFVNSMADVFHKDVPMEALARAWAVMAATPQHVYQILTKRHGRMHAVLSDPDGEFQGMVGEWRYLHGETDTTVPAPEDPSWGWPLPNVHLGVSVEDQKHADLRVPVLEDTPAAVRFLSCEPLLGPVDLSSWLDTPLSCGCGVAPDAAPDWSGGCSAGCMVPEPSGLSWVIVGGESGPGARPMREAWVRSLVQQCQAARVPVFVKQMGSVWAGRGKGGDMDAWPADLRVREFPEVAS